ncbi:MAG TPA: aminoglycoside phosphotransferase, partial [Candidatus Coproplasma excrementipullorum]|nr:aminoglycoside phosphotransferase [Candidatus Coproplasma excrementipullorum]
MSEKIIVAEMPGKRLYRDGDYAVKEFDAGYSKADILNEALNQARVEETDLNIPKIHAVQVVDGKWAIVMDYIEGVTLNKLMHEHPEKEDEYLN